MHKYKLADMTKGWFVGNFEPTVISTDVCEVGVKEYKAGDSEGAHYHKIATELTVVISGKVRMDGIEYEKGDIVKIEPGTVVDFVAITDTVTIVVKLPGALDDKYDI